MATITITVQGVPQSDAALKRLAEGARALGATTVVTGSTVAYAGYQETGTRFMAGTHYVKRAIDATAGRLATGVAAALLQGAGATRDAMVAGGRKIETAARPLARQDTGNLRRSLHTKAVR